MDHIRKWRRSVEVCDQLGDDFGRSVLWWFWQIWAQEGLPVETSSDTVVEFLELLTATDGLVPKPRSDRPVLIYIESGTPAHQGTLLPIVDRCIEDGIPVVLFYGHRPGDRWSDYVSKIEIYTMRDVYGTRRPANMLTAAASGSIQALSAWSKLARIDRDAERIFRRNPTWWAMHGFRFQIETSFCRELIRVLRPRFILSSFDKGIPGIALTSKSRALGIPSALLQHGILTFKNWPFFSDEIWLWGESFAQNARKFGVPPDRVRVIGRTLTGPQSPYPPPPTVNEKPQVTFISTLHGARTMPQLYAGFREFFSDVIRRTRDSFEWAIKLHPDEDSSFYDTLPDDIRECIYIYPCETNLDEALHDCLVAATVLSTGGLDAILTGRPVVAFEWQDKEVLEGTPWPPGAGRTASTPQEAAQLIEGALDAPSLRTWLAEQERFVAQNLSSKDGLNTVMRLLQAA